MAHDNEKILQVLGETSRAVREGLCNILPADPPAVMIAFFAKCLDLLEDDCVKLLTSDHESGNEPEEGRVTTGTIALDIEPGTSRDQIAELVGRAIAQRIARQE